MASPEFSHSSDDHLLPENIAFKAKFLWEERKSGQKAGGAVSKSVAVALVMKEEGISILKKMMSGFQDQIGIAPDISWVLDGLNPSSQKEVFYGLGEIILGSMLESIEKAIIGEWDDEAFLDGFNQAVVGTSFRKLNLSELIVIDDPSSRQKAMMEEAPIRKAILIEKKLISDFVKLPLDMSPLPQVMRVLLTRGMVDTLPLVIPTYEQAIKAL